MTRGNQRDVDRKRSKKRAEKAGLGQKKTSGNASQALSNKKEKDAEIMRKKQQAYMEKKAEEAAAGTSTSSKSSK